MRIKKLGPKKKERSGKKKERSEETMEWSTEREKDRKPEREGEGEREWDGLCMQMGFNKKKGKKIEQTKFLKKNGWNIF